MGMDLTPHVPNGHAGDVNQTRLRGCVKQVHAYGACTVKTRVVDLTEPGAVTSVFFSEFLLSAKCVRTFLLFVTTIIDTVVT